MDIFQLRYFISAATLQNFSNAAAENNISQSSFSKHIRALEVELGTELFSRKHRVIQLTAAGERFLDHAYAIVSSYNQMRSDMARFNRGTNTVISLGSIPVLPQYRITDAIAEFCAARRHITFSIMEGESAQILSGLNKMDTDFGILRTDFLNPAQYHMVPLVEDHLIALMCESHPLASQTQISLQALKEEKLVLPTRQSDLYAICENACLAAGFSPKIGYSISGKPDITIDIVRRGQAICLAMERVMSHYPLDGCRIVQLEQEIRSTTALTWLKSVYLNQACRMFKTFMMVRMNTE